MKIKELKRLIESQTKLLFNYDLNLSEEILNDVVTETKECISFSNNKYVTEEKYEIGFSIFNTIHNCIFLYKLSRKLFLLKEKEKAEKVYYLNKVLNCVELFYEVSLPKIWYAEHPVGSVMGKAEYSNYFFFYQGCTVGGNKNIYPKIGSNVIMYSNSKILGNSVIGNNVIISANCYIKDENIPSNSIVFGSSPKLIIKNNKQKEILW